MAKNKNLSELIGGFVSNPTNENEPENTYNTAHEACDESEIKAKRGRPKKAENENGVRTSVIIDKVLLAKLKYVSMMEGVLMKDVIINLLSGYLANWEDENGEIKLPKSMLK